MLLTVREGTYVAQGNHVKGNSLRMRNFLVEGRRKTYLHGLDQT
jgi:hypothetical protein